MMRPAFLVLVLLLLLVIDETQGIRLEHGFISIGHQKVHEVEESSLIQARSGGGDVGEVVLCKDGHCSTSSGRSRKLMTKTISSSTTSTPKTVKSTGGTEVDPKSKHQSSNIGLDVNKESFLVKQQPAASKHQEVGHEPYPDIIDIAGMDYSPARKKTPIHN